MGPLNDNLGKLGKGASKASKEVQSFADAIGKLNALGSTTRSNLDSQTRAFDDLSKSLGAMTGSLGKLGGAFESALSGIFGEDITDLIFGPLKAGYETLEATTKGALEGLKIMGEIFDAPSRDIRQFDNEMFSLGKRFGESVEEAGKFADSLKSETFSQFGTALRLTRNELSEYARAASSTNLTFQDLTETIDTAYGSTNLLAVATAFGSSTNMYAGSVMRTLNDLIKKQGVSSEEAANMLGVYAGVAKETGLSVESVISSLNGAVSGFGKLGVSADFGRPALEGFSRVVKEMGLGLEQAGTLASDLSSALAGVATNYSTAFIMSQRGGLEYGSGGGVLSSSIELQAALLQAERTGDQAQIGAELVTSLKDTLASFTGGQIVTVSEAAERPELSAQFYMQQQLLKSQFGLRDDASATRTLELLAEIDEATKTGNIDAKRELEEQLRTEVEGRDKLLGEFEKANRLLSAQSNYLAIIARPGLEQLKLTGSQLRDFFVDPVISSGGRAAAEGIGGLADKVGEASKSILDFFDLNKEEGFGMIAERVGAVEREQSYRELTGAMDTGSMTDEEIDRVIAQYRGSASPIGTSSQEELTQAISKNISDLYGGTEVKVKISFDGDAERYLAAAAEVAREAGQGSGG